MINNPPSEAQLSRGFVLDTSFVSALLNPNDIHHQKADSFWRSIIDTEEIYLPQTVLLELVNYFHRADNSLEVDIIKFIEVSAIIAVDINREFLDRYSQAVRSTRTKVSTIDLSVIATALWKGCKLITFDKKLQIVSESVLAPKV